MGNLLRILEINPVEWTVSKRTGKPTELHTVDCELLDEAGNICDRGRFVLPWALRERLGRLPSKGTYLPAISFVVSAGRLWPQVIDLIPVGS